MAEQMRKLRTIPLDKISGFLNRNGFDNVECKRYELGGDVKVSLDSIDSTFTGEIRGKKETYMEDIGIDDTDTVILKIEKGIVEEAKLLKDRIDVSRGYIFLEDSVDKDDAVYKSKIILNKNNEITSLNLTYDDSRVCITDEVTIGKNGNIDKYIVKSTGTKSFENYEGEFSWVNGVFTPVKLSTNLITLQGAYIAVYSTLNNLINGRCGIDLNETQKNGIQACIDSFDGNEKFFVPSFKEKK